MSHGRWLFQRRGEFLVRGLQGLFRFNFVRQHLPEMFEEDLFNYTVVGGGLDRCCIRKGLVEKGRMLETRLRYAGREWRPPMRRLAAR